MSRANRLTNLERARPEPDTCECRIGEIGGWVNYRETLEFMDLPEHEQREAQRCQKCGKMPRIVVIFREEGQRYDR